MRSEILGVAFWQASPFCLFARRTSHHEFTIQAPEVRRGPYNALKVDVWSLGATVWEMAETQPPFADTQQLADRWPSVPATRDILSCFPRFFTEMFGTECI